MALTTFSLFYFGNRITSDTRFLNFKEGVGPELTAEVVPKGYTITGLALALEIALNAAGALEWTVTVDRITRLITISADGAFTLLAGTGTNVGQSAWAEIGFDPVDVVGVTTATGDNPVGKTFAPQFILQDYIPKDKNRKALNAVVSKSASGKNVTVQTFGEERFIKFNIKYITNLAQSGGRIKDNPTGVEDALAFLDFITEKELFEFMPDIKKPQTFETVLLEEIGSDKDGTGYELREYYDQGLPFYFETGPMTLKVVE